MERTNFEKLQVYKLAEDLADEIWDVVRSWDYFAKDTVFRSVNKAALDKGKQRTKYKAQSSRV